jgi:hypothetical protein
MELYSRIVNSFLILTEGSTGISYVKVMSISMNCLYLKLIQTVPCCLQEMIMLRASTHWQVKERQIL